MTAHSETITVPRPKPNELVLAACDEHGAMVHVIVKKDTLQEGDVLPSLLPFFTEGQHIVHAQRADGDRH